MTRLISNGHRLHKLEQSRRYLPPYHLPPSQWTDEQLCLLITGGQRTYLTDEELQQCADEPEVPASATLDFDAPLPRDLIDSLWGKA